MEENEQSLNPVYAELAEKMIQEAKRMASETFKDFKKQFELELDFTSKSRLNYSKEVLDKLLAQYNLYMDVRNLKEIKAKMIQSLYRSKDIFLDDGQIDKERLDTVRSPLINQFLILKEIDYLKKDIQRLVEEEEMELIHGKGKRIKWLGKPSQLGYLINELINGDYIAIRKRNNKEELSPRSVARIIYSTFIIPDHENEGETSFENFYREVRSNSSTAGGRNWLTVKKRKIV